MFRKEQLALGVLLVASHVVAQATQPAAADPALKAMENFIAVAKTGDVDKTALLLFKAEGDSISDEPERILEAVKAGLFKSAAIVAHPGMTIEDVAILPVEIRLPGRRPDVEATYVIRRGDQWLILFAPEAERGRHLTADQKQRVDELRKWYDSDEQVARRREFSRVKPAE